MYIANLRGGHMVRYCDICCDQMIQDTVLMSESFCMIMQTAGFSVVLCVLMVE